MGIDRLFNCFHEDYDGGGLNVYLGNFCRTTSEPWIDLKSHWIYFVFLISLPTRREISHQSVQEKLREYLISILESLAILRRFCLGNHDCSLGKNEFMVERALWHLSFESITKSIGGAIRYMFPSLSKAAFSLEISFVSWPFTFARFCFVSYLIHQMCRFVPFSPFLLDPPVRL